MSAISQVNTLGLDATAIGFSTEANSVDRWTCQSKRHYLMPRLSLLIPEIEGLADESDGGKRADPETVRAALWFAHCLPRFAPLPEVSVDPDGEISFDWLTPNGDMFSVSINKQNRLAYAGWFGEKSRIHGVEQLAETCPSEVIRGVHRATFTDRQSEHGH